MRLACALVLLIALSGASACSRQAPAPARAPAVQVAAAAVTAVPSPSAMSTPTRSPTPRPLPTAAPTAPPAPSPVVLSKWFEPSHDCWNGPFCISYAFEIENPGRTRLVADYRVHVRVLPELAPFRDYESRRDMREIVTEWSWVPLTPAGGRTAVTGRADVPDPAGPIAGVTIEIAKSRRSTELEAPIPPPTSLTIFKNPKGFTATGILANPWKDTLTDVYMVALAFDEAGQVIGVGYDLTAFLQPGEQGVRFDFESTGTPTEVRAYGGAEPAEYSVGLLYRYGDREPGPEVTDTGFVQHGGELTYVFVLENRGSEDMDTRYVVTAYDGAGRVIGVRGLGGLDLLPYGARYGVVDTMELATGDVPVARLGVQVQRFGRMGMVPPVPRFEDIRYTARGGHEGEVTAKVSDPGADLPFNTLTAVAVTYDGRGKINGGGSLVLPVLEPGASASIRIPVVVSGTVDRVELLPKILEGILFTPDQAMAAPAMVRAAGADTNR